MHTINLYSANISSEDLLTVIYYQTGIDYRDQINQYDNIFKCIEEYRVKFIEFVKQFEFNIEYIFEDENNFYDTNNTILTSWKTNKVRKNFDLSLDIMVMLRRNKINFTYIPKESDMKILESSSPPLYDWIVNTHKNN
jgi:hypothetical protein